MIEIKQDPSAARNVKRVERIINATFIAPEQKDVTSDYRMAGRIGRFKDSKHSALSQQFAGSKLEVESEKMYLASPEVSYITDGIAEDATSSDWGKPFDIIVDSKDSRRQEITRMLDLSFCVPPVGMLKGMQLYSRAYNIIRDGIKLGRVFYMKTIDVDRRMVISLDRIPGPAQGFRMYGPLGNHPNPDMIGGWQLINTTSGQIIWEFRDWQITSFVWNRSEIDRHEGLPHFASAIRTFNRLELAEKDLPNTRHYNAFPRLGFEHDMEKAGAGKTLETVVTEHDNLMAVGDGEYDWGDVHTSGKVHTLNFDTSTLSNVDDIKYQQGKIFTRGGRPASFIAGNDRPVNRATLDRQETRYTSGIVSRAQSMYSEGLIDIVLTQFALQGIDFLDYPVSFMWKPKVILDSNIVNALRATVQSKILSRQFFYSAVGTTLERQMEEMKQEAEIAALQQPQPQQVLPPNNNGQTNNAEPAAAGEEPAAGENKNGVIVIDG